MDSQFDLKSRTDRVNKHVFNLVTYSVNPIIINLITNLPLFTKLYLLQMLDKIFEFISLLL